MGHLLPRLVLLLDVIVSSDRPQCIACRRLLEHLVESESRFLSGHLGSIFPTFETKVLAARCIFDKLATALSLKEYPPEKLGDNAIHSPKTKDWQSIRQLESAGDEMMPHAPRSTQRF